MILNNKTAFVTDVIFKIFRAYPKISHLDFKELMHEIGFGDFIPEAEKLEEYRIAYTTQKENSQSGSISYTEKKEKVLIALSNKPDMRHRDFVALYDIECSKTFFNKLKRAFVANKKSKTPKDIRFESNEHDFVCELLAKNPNMDFLTAIDFCPFYLTLPVFCKAHNKMKKLRNDITQKEQPQPTVQEVKIIAAKPKTTFAASTDNVNRIELILDCYETIKQILNRLETTVGLTKQEKTLLLNRFLQD